MNGKDWYTSKTFVGNAIVLIIAIATMITDPVFAFAPQTVRIAVGVILIGNMALRLVTSAPINGTKAARKRGLGETPLPGDQQ